jgi:hypothetical protein
MSPPLVDMVTASGESTSGSTRNALAGRCLAPQLKEHTIMRKLTNKSAIALAAAAALLAVSTLPASARFGGGGGGMRGGGGFSGGGMRGGSFSMGGGMRGGSIGMSSGMRSSGHVMGMRSHSIAVGSMSRGAFMSSGVVRSGNFARFSSVRPAFVRSGVGVGAFKHRPFVRNRFLFVGGGYPYYSSYYGSCYRTIFSPLYGWVTRNVCYDSSYYYY